VPSQVDQPTSDKPRVGSQDDALGEFAHLRTDCVIVTVCRQRLIPGFQRLEHQTDLFRAITGPPQTQQRARTVFRQQISNDHLAGDVTGNDPGGLRRVNGHNTEFGERLPNERHRVGESQAGRRFAGQLSQCGGLDTGNEQIARQPDSLPGRTRSISRSALSRNTRSRSSSGRFSTTAIETHDRADRYRIFAITCPIHGNAGWRWIRDNDTDGWAEAVEFDKAIRYGCPHATEQGQQLRWQYFLHRSCQPLGEVDLDPPSVVTTRQLKFVSTSSVEEGDPDGCSPWSCRSGAPVTTEPAA
jgi:hypothetical protein